MSCYLLIPHMKVHNANALSSPFTIGFPAMTAWLGAVHALQRKLNQRGIGIQFKAAGIVSHQFNLQTHQHKNDYVTSIIGTANPLDKNGSRPSFIEEARCHLEISLVIEIPELELSEETLISEVCHILHSSMKMASGDILGFKPPRITSDGDKLLRQMMPGYALIERRDLMTEAMTNGQDALDALLDYLTVKNTCTQDDQGNIKWHRWRKESGENGEKGWLVPIATGFHRLTELGNALNQRTPDVPHGFAESLVTLGEFRMPFKFERIQDILWAYEHEPATRQYRCQMAYQNENQNYDLW